VQYDILPGQYDLLPMQYDILPVQYDLLPMQYEPSKESVIYHSSGLNHQNGLKMVGHHHDIVYRVSSSINSLKRGGVTLGLLGLIIHNKAIRYNP
jgi:hypothetical protein